ncbi:lycopene beta-cyclase CrtY [Devosia albogilva]|uniref:Lycopene beta-cyclase CrtY n=1 Tax=Devosia albogilva TaxID=429726 RepID=A0ABW5QH56_9HYPH
MAGGGLAAALIARRLSLHSNDRVLILEAAPEPFGEHTWSFHLHDVGEDDLPWLIPMMAYQWPGQAVRFRNYRRDLSSGYATLTSASVRESMKQLRNVEIRCGVRVESVGSDRVWLSNGETLDANCVIDARGYRSSSALVLGYQKFVGLEVETSAPHGVHNPVIMDASVDQHDGYRFVYLLPFSQTRILIEDTRYADGEALDDAALERDIHGYAAHQGWSISRVVRRERGVLPISLAHDADRFWAEVPPDVPQAGMRAALFHPTTGYSLPEAVRVANLVAEAWPIGSAALAGKLREHAVRRHREQRFYRLLNRMLFLAAAPHRRHLVLQRFYRLPEPLIERFYAGRTTWADMARILVGKPPVPVHRALACLRERPLFTPERS